MSNLNVNGSDLAEILENSKVPVLVDFWAPWCGPCRAIAPILEAYAEDHKDDIRVVKINVDESPEMTDKYNFRSIPTLILIDGGMIVDTKSGGVSRAGLEDFVSGALNDQAEEA